MKPHQEQVMSTNFTLEFFWRNLDYQSNEKSTKNSERNFVCWSTEFDELGYIFFYKIITWEKLPWNSCFFIKKIKTKKSKFLKLFLNWTHQRKFASQLKAVSQVLYLHFTDRRKFGHKLKAVAQVQYTCTLLTGESLDPNWKQFLKFYTCTLLIEESLDINWKRFLKFYTCTLLIGGSFEPNSNAIYQVIQPSN